MKLCGLVNLWAGLYEEAPQHLPRWVRAHQDRCPTCRAMREDHHRLADSLRLAASEVTPQSPTFLVHRICSALEHETPRRRGAQIKSLLPASALAVALVLLFFVLPWQFRRSQQPSSGSTASLVPRPAVPFSWDLIAATEDPLTRELELALEDGRSAITFLTQALPPIPTLGFSESRE